MPHKIHTRNPGTIHALADRLASGGKADMSRGPNQLIYNVGPCIACTTSVRALHAQKDRNLLTALELNLSVPRFETDPYIARAEHLMQSRVLLTVAALMLAGGTVFVAAEGTCVYRKPRFGCSGDEVRQGSDLK